MHPARLHATLSSVFVRVAVVAGMVLGLAAPAAQAQIAELLNTSPRGLIETTPAATPSAAAAATPASTPAPTPTPGLTAGPLPPDPALSAKPQVFGSQMFTGRFGREAFTGFNPEYQLAVGDRVIVRMWGAFNYESTQPVDAQGNLFLPNIGPVHVLGIRNSDLNAQVENQIKRVFRANVGVYATLEAAQPVKVYVTGFVRAPGLYAGLSSDSVLSFLDRAGGIDPDRGSYLEVQVLRGGRPRATVQLYRFLLDGKIDPLQMQDGDTVVVAPRQHTVQIGGEVTNPYIFEFAKSKVPASDLLALARPRPGATHLSIVRRTGAERRSEYFPLGDAANVDIFDGDEVTVTSDKSPGTILVHIEGAHLGQRTLVMPYGAKLGDAIALVRPAPQASMQALQLFRRSVADRQRELLENSLHSLETYALTARSATSEEASLRGRESQQILEFIDRARKIQPKGQVILAGGTATNDTLLEDGDVIRVPETSNLVQVSGEVLIPNALAYDARADVDTYIRRAGGYTQGADQAKVLVLHQDGSVAQSAGESTGLKPSAGDEILVLPKIETKNIEVTRGITQILYQTAIAARVVMGIF